MMPLDDDRPHEECGVIGVYAPGREVARVLYFGMYALQHRGQESAGIATSDGVAAFTHRGLGLVAQVFDEASMTPLVGTHGIGHTRYATTGASNVRNASPVVIETALGPLGVSHNGNLTNAQELRQRLLERGVGLSSTTDSEVLTQMLAAPPEVWSDDPPPATGGDEIMRRLTALLGVAEGAYSLAILTRNGIYAMRDAVGLRPLCLGELPDGGFVVASESCALGTIGARFVRDVAPGEIVRIDEGGVSSTSPLRPLPRALCVFEHVYFARPDSTLDGQVVHDVRQRLGRQLAREAPAEADIVVGVPDSATPAAIGFSLESGIPFTEGLIKNRYIGRTFIQPDQKLRATGVRLKYNPLTTNLRGRRVVLIDDSIVRGTTIRQIVQLVRDGGATEVHVRVSSPPVRHPCFMGVDMATHRELVANGMDIDAIRLHVGADSLAYLSLDGLMKATHGVETAAVPSEQPATVHGQGAFCAACFSGRYPVQIPDWLLEEDRDRHRFEETWG